MRDVGRLLHYGEQFGSDKIDVRMLPLQLHAASGALALFDPGDPGAASSWHVLERPLGSGAFRVMLSVARPDGEPSGAARERLAAVTIHVGRPPIARWIAAQFRGSPRSEELVPRTHTSSGWLALLDAGEGPPGVLALPPNAGVSPVQVPLTDGRRALALPCEPGAFAAYWAVDAADKPVCIVIDLDAFPARAWSARRAT